MVLPPTDHSNLYSANQIQTTRNNTSRCAILDPNQTTYTAIQNCLHSIHTNREDNDTSRLDLSLCRHDHSLHDDHNPHLHPHRLRRRHHSTMLRNKLLHTVKKSLRCRQVPNHLASTCSRLIQHYTHNNPNRIPNRFQIQFRDKKTLLR